MSGSADQSQATRTITVHVPFAFKRRGGRKLILGPDGADWAPATPSVNGPLVKAVARAFRWRKLLDEGEYSTTEELAKAEKVNSSYLGRVLRLTLLAPDILEAILDGRQSPALTVEGLLEKIPEDWSEQRAVFECKVGPPQTSRV